MLVQVGAREVMDAGADRFQERCFEVFQKVFQQLGKGVSVH